MKTSNNTRYGQIVEGTEGDDTIWWIVEPRCEDIGPFDSRKVAEEFLAELRAALDG